MAPINTKSCWELDDHALLARSLAGDLEAFRQIAARYYPLIRMLAYDATGNSNLSDDLARDTFVAAWRQLGGVRPPVKLRSWLCGIARELVSDFLRARAAAERSSSASGASSAGLPRAADGPVPL